MISPFDLPSISPRPPSNLPSTSLQSALDLPPISPRSPSDVPSISLLSDEARASFARSPALPCAPEPLPSSSHTPLPSPSQARADSAFLDDLANLGGLEASKLHAYLVDSTPELASSPRRSAQYKTAERSPPRARGFGILRKPIDPFSEPFSDPFSDPFRRRYEMAERSLLASLLSYNALLPEARKAAALVAAHPALAERLAKATDAALSGTRDSGRRSRQLSSSSAGSGQLPTALSAQASRSSFGDLNNTYSGSYHEEPVAAAGPPPSLPPSPPASRRPSRTDAPPSPPSSPPPPPSEAEAEACAAVAAGQPPLRKPSTQSTDSGGSLGVANLIRRQGSEVSDEDSMRAELEALNAAMGDSGRAISFRRGGPPTPTDPSHPDFRQQLDPPTDAAALPTPPPPPPAAASSASSASLAAAQPPLVSGTSGANQSGMTDELLAAEHSAVLASSDSARDEPSPGAELERAGTLDRMNSFLSGIFAPPSPAAAAEEPSTAQMEEAAAALEEAEAAEAPSLLAAASEASSVGVAIASASPESPPPAARAAREPEPPAEEDEAPTPAPTPPPAAPCRAPSGPWDEGSGEAAELDWTGLRQQWTRARTLMREMHEAYARTISADERATDGASSGLQKLTKLLLLVAKQQHNAPRSEHDIQQLYGDAAALGGDVRRLFDSLFRHDVKASAGAVASTAAGSERNLAEKSGRKVEQEVVDLVAARVDAKTLRKIMYKQQCRAYSRAAGYHALKELLGVCDGSPRLQCKLLDSLVNILRPPSASADSAIVTHYSRDVQCAGPHAGGRLRLAFAALVGSLVGLLPGDALSAPSAPSALSAAAKFKLPLQSLWAMRCLLHMELREEDLAVQQAVRLLPTFHDVVRRLHGEQMLSPPHPMAQGSFSSKAHAWPSDAADAAGGASKQLPRTVQLAYQTIVSRVLQATPEQAAAPKGAKGGVGGTPALARGATRTHALTRGSSRTAVLAAPAGSSSAGEVHGEIQGALEDLLQRHLRDVEAAAEGLRAVLEEGASTALGADTSSDTWLTLERWLYGSLALLFQARAPLSSRTTLDLPSPPIPTFRDLL